MTHLNRGIFDEASVSVITSATVGGISELAGTAQTFEDSDRTFWSRLCDPIPFEEDAWVEGLLSFGEGDQAATIGVTNRDERCSMVNFDPDSARAAPEVLKAVVRERDNKAGVYGTVIRRGRSRGGAAHIFRAAVTRRECMVHGGRRLNSPTPALPPRAALRTGR